MGLQTNKAHFHIITSSFPLKELEQKNSVSPFNFFNSSNSILQFKSFWKDSHSLTSQNLSKRAKIELLKIKQFTGYFILPQEEKN